MNFSNIMKQNPVKKTENAVKIVKKSTSSCHKWFKQEWQDEVDFIKNSGILERGYRRCCIGMVGTQTETLRLNKING